MTQDSRSPEHDNKRAWVLPVLLATLSLVVSGWTTYANNDKALAVQIGQLETQQRSDYSRLDRVQIQLQHIEDKVDQVIRDASAREREQRAGWFYVPPETKKR